MENFVFMKTARKSADIKTRCEQYYKKLLYPKLDDNKEITKIQNCFIGTYSKNKKIKITSKLPIEKGSNVCEKYKDNIKRLICQSYKNFKTRIFISEFTQATKKQFATLNSITSNNLIKHHAKKSLTIKRKRTAPILEVVAKSMIKTSRINKENINKSKRIHKPSKSMNESLISHYIIPTRKPTLNLLKAKEIQENYNTCISRIKSNNVPKPKEIISESMQLSKKRITSILSKVKGEIVKCEFPIKRIDCDK